MITNRGITILNIPKILPTKIQIDFDENEQMKEFIEDEIQEPTGDKIYKKRFFYKNGILRKVQIAPEEIKGYSIESNKTFIFQNGFKCFEKTWKIYR